MKVKPPTRAYKLGSTKASKYHFKNIQRSESFVQCDVTACGFVMSEHDKGVPLKDLKADDICKNCSGALVITDS